MTRGGGPASTIPISSSSGPTSSYGSATRPACAQVYSATEASPIDMRVRECFDPVTWRGRAKLVSRDDETWMKRPADGEWIDSRA